MISKRTQYAGLIAVAIVAAAGIYWYVSRHAEPTTSQIRGAIGQDVDGSVLTGSYDNFRTNAYLVESVLTPSTVKPATFGKAFTLAVDGAVYAQPLYMQALSVKDVRHNVVFVATMHNSVYAFDADTPGLPLWNVNLGPAVATSTYGTPDEPYTDIQPENGILGTPVIDVASSTLYVVAATLENGVYAYRLHALDCTTGAARPGSPMLIEAQVAGTGDASVNGKVSFDAKQHLQRAALLLSKGTVFVAFGSHGDNDPYHGWLMGYNAATLERTSTFNATPNGDGGAFWQSGRGPAVDEDGNIYLVAGNGAADLKTNFGNSILRLDPQGATLTDFFTPWDVEALNDSDSDLMGGPVLIPGTKLLLGSGKAGVLYLLDRTNLGHSAANDAQISQRLDTGNQLLFNMALWNRPDGPVLYTHLVNAPVTGYKLLNGKLGSTPAVSAKDGFPVPYQGMALSANGYLAGTGVLWVLAPSGSPRSPAILHAYNADSLEEIWNSRMTDGDAVGSYMKFTNPTVANGKVYVPTGDNQLVVYGPVSSRDTTSVRTPVVTGIVNAASYASGPLAPGEIVAILGQYLGPDTAAAGTVDPTGNLGTSLAGVEVRFNGIPAPLFAASSGLVTAVIPWEVAGTDSVTLQLSYNGAQAAPIKLALAETAPGIFSTDSSGRGNGAFPNEDGTLNSRENPAKAGSIITISGTGGGQTNPPSATGVIATGEAALTTQTSVTVAGKPARIDYAGAAPGAVSGAFQVRLRLPASLPSGPAAVVLTVGGQASQGTVTVSVQ